MDSESPGGLTALLRDVRTGDPHAKDRLVRAIYDELRRVAAGLMRREQPGHTLQPTALVHEALLRLLDGAALEQAPDHHYIYAAAARAMREVLVDHARRRTTAKRGGGWKRLPLDEVLTYFEAQKLDVLALD